MTFGEDVSQLISGLNKFNLICAEENVLSYEMIIRLNMFSAGMKNQIGSDVDSAEVATK